MKIFTRIEWVWNGRQYIVAAEESFDYCGPLTLCGGGDESGGSASGEGGGGKNAVGAPGVNDPTKPGGYTQTLDPSAAGGNEGATGSLSYNPYSEAEAAEKARQETATRTGQGWTRADLINMGHTPEEIDSGLNGQITQQADGSYTTPGGKDYGKRDMYGPAIQSLMSAGVMAPAAAELMAGAQGLAGGAVSGAGGLPVGEAASAFGPATGTILPAGEAASGAVSGAAAGAGAPTVIGTATGAAPFVAPSGAPLGAPGTTAGTTPATAPGETPPTKPPGESSILQQAGQGAVRGAVTSGVQGENPLKGAATGALTSGITGGINEAISGAGSGTPAVTGLPTGGDSSIYTGGTPTDVPNPVADQVVSPPATPAAPSAIQKAMKALGIYDSTAGTIGGNVLPLAMAGAGQIAARNSAKSLPNELRAAAGPARNAADQLLERGLAGQVPPAIMQQFETSYKNRVGEITQRFANMGRDAKTDSAAQAEIAKAKDAMDAQVAQYASTLTTQGLQAAGLAQGPTTQAALAGAQQDQALQASMANALQQMAMLKAMQGNRQGAPAATSAEIPAG